MSNEAERIRKEVTKSPLTVSRVYTGSFQKEGTVTAEIKQTVETKSFYPSKSVTSDKQGNIFAMQDFGFEEKDFTSSETRVAWLDVPANSTLESVTQTLAKHPEAELYRTMASKPIITDNQQYAIETGLSDHDHFANSQAVRFPKGHANAGSLALHKGAPQYRAVFFWPSVKADEDYRGEEAYVSPELQAEMDEAGILADTDNAHVVATQQL